VTAVQRPIGFTLIAIYLTVAVMNGLSRVWNAEQSLPVGMAALPLVSVVLAAVAAEALWFCRPWCVRAIVAYWCVMILDPLVDLVRIGEMKASQPLISFVLFVGVAAVLVGYVRHRAGRLFAPPAGRVPIPAPRP
jgi:hypothetical protein